MDDLFAPPALDWQRISPNYRSLRRLTTLIFLPLFLLVPVLVFGALTDWWWLAGPLAAIVVALIAWRLVLIDRTWRAWGYAEREDDLYITHGVLFRSLVAVPYGRMQLVEVASGPLERAFGLATVTLKTASVETSATIPGLPPQEAARLRDRLTTLAETRPSGL